MPAASEQALLEQVRLVLLTDPKDRRRLQTRLDRHHYLSRLQAVGEQLHYAAVEAQGQWVAVLLFSAAAKHLKHRDAWIGWSRAQRDRRRALLANSSRFLVLPQHAVPNLASRVLALALQRLAADWQARYGHPVLGVETLVGDLDLAGRTVALDALHTQDQTARELVLEHGAHYLLTVKHDQPHLRANVEQQVPAPPTGFSPSPAHADLCAHG
jgi:hypothetical protein